MPMNIDIAKSYKTEANLVTALKLNDLADAKHLVVCNRTGRFTAIFPRTWNNDIPPMAIAENGFFVVG